MTLNTCLLIFLSDLNKFSFYWLTNAIFALPTNCIYNLNFQVEWYLDSQCLFCCCITFFESIDLSCVKWRLKTLHWGEVFEIAASGGEQSSWQSGKELLSKLPMQFVKDVGKCQLRQWKNCKNDEGSEKDKLCIFTDSRVNWGTI